jgi:hypothetical protein
MRLVSTRENTSANTVTKIDRSLIAPRKAYRVAGVVVCITENGREMLLQWRSRDDMWCYGAFVVTKDAVFAIEGRGPSHWNTPHLKELVPGTIVTIDYLPLGPQNLALVIRGGSDENTLAATNITKSGRLQTPDEAFCSSMADVAFHRIAEKKACA